MRPVHDPGAAPDPAAPQAAAAAVCDPPGTASPLERPGGALSRRPGSPRERQAVALTVSLLVHALLLGLAFGGAELGLPGFELPWKPRRFEAPELRVVILPAPPARPATQAPDEPTPPPAMATLLHAQDGPATPVERAAAPALPALWPSPLPAQDAPAAERHVIALAPPDRAEVVVPRAASAPAPASAAPTPERAPQPPASAAEDAAQRIAAAAPDRPAEPPQADPPEPQAAQQEQARQEEAARQEAARQEAARQEAARQEAARLEAARKEAERQASARAEAARQEALRAEAARAEAARLEAARLEAARLEAARLEAARLEAARLEAARQEAARQEAARAEAARAEAERQEAARQDAARQEAARVQAARADEERREAARRAMGRQLDAEAAARDAAASRSRAPNALPPAWSSARRGRLFGRADANAELVLYAEAFARKIQLNMTIETAREAARKPHADPLVTVAIRSDGSVESVVFVTSSGVPELDEAIRRIVQSQAPYQPFSPALAREFDVVEIRRTWIFDMAVRLY